MDDDDDLVAMATGAALGVSPIASPTVSPRSRSLQFSPPSETPFSALVSPAAAASSSARRAKSKRTVGAASFAPDTDTGGVGNGGGAATTAAAAADADSYYDAAAENTWPPLSCDVFRGWGEFFRLGAPAALSLIIEWGSYEVTAWAAGRLGATSLATHTVFMQTCGTIMARFHLLWHSQHFTRGAC
jgi:hypothetical protein